MVESDILIPEHLPSRIFSSQKTVSKKSIQTDKLKNAEATVIINTLESSNWNISKAAAVLGIGRNTLYRKIERYNLRQDRSHG